MAALDPAADPAFAPELGAPWQVMKAYWMTLSRGTVQRAVDLGLVPSSDALPSSLPDEEITAVLDGRQYLDAKVAALRAHRSQVDLENGLFAILTKVPEFAVENYLLARGERAPGSGPYSWENDLFAGIDAPDSPESGRGEAIA